jgi:hypothetical protein
VASTAPLRRAGGAPPRGHGPGPAQTARLAVFFGPARQAGPSARHEVWHGVPCLAGLNAHLYSHAPLLSLAVPSRGLGLQNLDLDSVIDVVVSAVILIPTAQPIQTRQLSVVLPWLEASPTSGRQPSTATNRRSGHVLPSSPPPVLRTAPAPCPGRRRQQHHQHQQPDRRPCFASLLGGEERRDTATALP